MAEKVKPQKRKAEKVIEAAQSGAAWGHFAGHNDTGTRQSRSRCLPRQRRREAGRDTRKMQEKREISCASTGAPQNKIEPYDLLFFTHARQAPEQDGRAIRRHKIQTFTAQPYYTPKTLEFQGKFLRFSFFVNYADFYVNAFMSTRATGGIRQCTDFYDFSRCGAVWIPYPLNVVFAGFLAFLRNRVNAAYPIAAFVQLNECGVFSSRRLRPVPSGQPPRCRPE